MADGDHTHYIGDGCWPDGHGGDPGVAAKLNDQLLEQTEDTVALDLVSEGGLLSDRQAALFAAIQFCSPHAPFTSVREVADGFHTWLTQDQEQADG